VDIHRRTLHQAGIPLKRLYIYSAHRASSRIQTQTDPLAICPPNNWYYQVPFFVEAAQRKPDRDPAKNFAIHFPATTKNAPREPHQPPSFLINTREIQVDSLIYLQEKPSLYSITTIYCLDHLTALPEDELSIFHTWISGPLSDKQINPAPPRHHRKASQVSAPRTQISVFRFTAGSSRQLLTNSLCLKSYSVSSKPPFPKIPTSITKPVPSSQPNHPIVSFRVPATQHPRYPCQRINVGSSEAHSLVH
jgi:hypothetical protein